MADDPLNLAVVDVEFARYGALAMTGAVPGLYCLLDAWCFGHCRSCILLRDRHRVVHAYGGRERGAGSVVHSDERHEEFERAGQR